MKKLTTMLEDEFLTSVPDPVPRGRQKQFPISGKLRPLKMLRASLLLAFTALLSWFGSEARAVPVTVTCDGEAPVTGDVVVNAFPGGGSATVDADSSTAGPNNFYNSIHMNLNTAAGVAPGNEAPHSTVAVVTTHPTWDYSPVNTSLTLNGGVQFSDPNDDNDKIILTLTGLLGGPQLTITYTITASDYRAAKKDINGFDNFSINTNGFQAASINAVETLTVNTVGRILYQNDDTFVGAPDVSSTFPLFGLGAVSLLAYGWCGKKERRTAS
jgi:hypothetical protein